MSTMNRTTEANELELRITRVFDAPREVVFKAWTEPAQVMRWWGPRGFTLPSCEMDLRPGGTYRFQMRGPGGEDHWTQGVFREVVVPERLVMAGSWVDAAGQPTAPQTLLTLAFEELGTKTRLTLHQVGFESVSARDAHRNGWSSSIERLAEYLETA